jgi:hypothetical protein
VTVRILSSYRSEAFGASQRIGCPVTSCTNSKSSS